MRSALPAELLAVWALFAVVAAEIAVTYARLPAAELYHVSGTGVAAGLGRALVFLNFPTALAAIGVALVLLDRLGSRQGRAAALLAIGLCAVVVWPGVVDQADLDAKPINAVPAVGVALVLALTVALVARGGVSLRTRAPGDRLRLSAALVLLALALPWVAADLGLSFGGVPVLGSLYQTSELRYQPGISLPHPAVHHGHHHGMDGTLLVLTAALLSRSVFGMRGGRLRSASYAYLALMLCYGAANVANDFWLEQVVKRGWTTWQIPDVTSPHVSAAWAAIVVAAASIWLELAFFRRSGAPGSEQLPRRSPPRAAERGP